MTYLNIGSGQRPFAHPNWINVDSQKRWKPDIVCDGASLAQPDNTVDIIVLHHVLEHFGCGEADRLLANCYRMLKPRGSLLVFVPDMWELAQGWIKGRINNQLYFTNVYGAYMGDEADRHKFGFSQSSLFFLLRNSGFKRVIPFNWRLIEGADLARDWWVLSLEAVK